jgi:hypothetical protein
MKFSIILVFALVVSPLCFGGGSIGWDDVSTRVGRSDPGLIKVINDAYKVAPVGSALRLGPRSVDVVEGKAEAGTRLPPYEFDCKPKGKPGPFSLHLTIDEGGDGKGNWHFTVKEAAK